jgi:tetratricopeptide (TPR) repeat protein
VLEAEGAQFEDAVAAFEARRFKQAIELFTDAIDSGGLENDRLAQARAYRGHAHYFRGEYETAAENCSAALTLDPASEDARHALVAALVAVGNYARALAEADQAVQQNPSDSIAFGNRCDIRRMLKEFELALVDCDRAIELNPGFAYSWAERAKLYRDWGHHAEARSDAKAAFELSPHHPTIRELAKYYGLLSE